MLIQENVPLAPRTTLAAGGAARWLIEAASETEVAAALAWAGERALPTLVLGGGSNLLVADRGFDGLVLRVRVAGVQARPGPSEIVEVEAGAGEPWDALVEHTVTSGWAGLECLSGIPGDVGATPIQNVGAYGQEVADTLVRVRVIDRKSGNAADLSREACRLGYRDSVFKREAKDRWIVVAVTFALRPGGAPALRYAELARRFTAGASPSLREVREAVVALRRSKSMVLDPADENGRSAGSFFMNPTLDPAAAERTRERVRAASVLAPGEAMPEFPAAEGRVKLSAAWLIERAGFRKGTGEGRVGISTRHTLAIVNRGGATAAEIVAFARGVREGVYDRFGVALAAEPVLVGFAPGETEGLTGALS
jgi:UDP-N-acetylmuramate dehydrogenase